MKKQTDSRLRLKKEIVARLQAGQMQRLVGGDSIFCTRDFSCRSCITEVPTVGATRHCLGDAEKRLDGAAYDTLKSINRYCED